MCEMCDHELQTPGLDYNEAIFSEDEVNLFRQWFDAVQDITPQYLNHDDYALAKKLYEILSMRVPNSIEANVIFGGNNAHD